MAPPPDELIIVADGGDEKVCAAAKPDAMLVRTATPLGPAGARNAGARAASGALLFFVDSDVAVPPDAIDRIKRAIDAPEAPDAIIGSYDTHPPQPDFLSQYKNLAHHFVHQTGRCRANTFFGACGVIKRSVFFEVGGFDERYDAPCIEDIELGYRLKDAGHEILLSKTLQVTHLKKWRTAQLLYTDFYRRALPWSRLILSVRRMDNDLNIDWAARLKVTMTALLLVQLVATAWIVELALSAAVTAALLLAADWKLYRFFARHKGRWFAARVPLWHWFYYAYSGAAFGWALVERLVGSLRGRVEQGRAVRRKRAW